MSRHTVTYPFFLPNVRFAMYNGAYQDPGGPIVLAASDDPERLAAGDLVEVLPYHPHRVRVASSI